MNVDIIVNAANTELKAGGGVCGAIFDAAGADRLQAACDKLAPIKTGDAVITKGFALHAKYIIHAVGPVYKDGMHDEEAQLRSCYRNALELAGKHGCKTIAFPLISSGIYGYPKDEALRVATSEVGAWLMGNDMEVSLVVFDKAAFALSGNLQREVKSFINEKYVDERNVGFGRSGAPLWDRSGTYETRVADASINLYVSEERPDSKIETLRSVSEFSPEPVMSQLAPATPGKEKKTDDIISRLDEPFSTTLLRLIDKKGKTDVEVYKRANLDRKLFSKIRKGKGYMPSKKTAVALAIALELSLPETRDLLERAGFALSRSVLFDLIIEYFISRRKYDVFEINNVLFEYDQSLLGG